MENINDNITLTKVQSKAQKDKGESEHLFVELDKAQGFREGDTVIVLHYRDFANTMDVSTVSELKRKLESYTNSFKRVSELKMKLESMETYYKEQLQELKAQYNHQLSKLTKKIP